MQRSWLGEFIYLIFLLIAFGFIGARAGTSAEALPNFSAVRASSPPRIEPVSDTAAAAATPANAEVGVASWYGGRDQQRLTASGERFDRNKLTAAHRHLPLDTVARVTNLANGRSVEVTVNDRGPYVHGRVIDLSARAARELGMLREGLALVRIEVLPLEAAGSAMN
jgi:rare lipoprotein A